MHLTKKTIFIFITILCLNIFVAKNTVAFFGGEVNVSTNDYWQENSNLCPNVVNGISCQTAEISCGLDGAGAGASPVCFVEANISFPGTPETSVNTNNGGLTNGGYVLDCYSNTGSTAPFCDNTNGEFWCNYSDTCYTTRNRITECIGWASDTGEGNAWQCQAGAEGSSTGCVSGWYNCYDDGAGANGKCESLSNGSYASNNYVHGDSSLNANYTGASCSIEVRASNYLDCDTDIGLINFSGINGSDGYGTEINDSQGTLTTEGSANPGKANTQYAISSTNAWEVDDFKGVCDLECDTNYGSCNGDGSNSNANDADGCEAKVSGGSESYVDLDSAYHARYSGSCSASVCESASWLDCDNGASHDGSDWKNKSAASGGGCESAYETNSSWANTFRQAEASSCSIQCDAGYQSCTDHNGNSSTSDDDAGGCEVQTDVTACENSGNNNVGSGCQCQCDSGYLSCNDNMTVDSANDTAPNQGCEIQQNATLVRDDYNSIPTWTNVEHGSTCSAFQCVNTYGDCNEATLGIDIEGTTGTADNGGGDDGSCERQDADDASAVGGQNTEYLATSNVCRIICSVGYFNWNKDGDGNPLASGNEGCEVQNNVSSCIKDNLPGIWQECDTGTCTCELIAAELFATGGRTIVDEADSYLAEATQSYTINTPLLWGQQDGPGDIAKLYTNTASTTSIFTIANDGSVGIGTSTPIEKLTIAGIMALKATSSPALTTGYGKLYVNSSDNNKLYYMTPDGTDSEVGTAAAGGLTTILSDLTDVSLSSTSTNDFLSFSGSNWQNISTSTARTNLGLGNLATLDTVSSSTLNTSNQGTDGQFLSLNASGQLTWNNAAAGISDLTDVGSAATTSGNILIADGTDWESVAQINITSLGTIATGTWEADVIDIAYGGTGTSSLPGNGQALVSNGSSYDFVNISAFGSGSVNTGSSTQIAYYESDGETVTANPNFIIDADGKVGLGASNPDSMLTISQDASTTPIVNIEQSNGASAFYIDESGNIAIGSSSPNALLHVYGGARIDGDLDMNGNNIVAIDKLTVTTIDPLYDIDNIKYSTYGPSFAGGVKEEVAGVIQLRVKNDLIYQYIINFSNLREGSDLWLFAQVVDFGKNWENLIINLTSSFEGKIWYKKDIENNSLIIYGSLLNLSKQDDVKLLEASYHFIANRFDWKKWPNLAPDQNEKAGLKIYNK